MIMVTTIMIIRHFWRTISTRLQQQFDSGKLGIWLFLVTEVLFFSGMFCAYALFQGTSSRRV